jgi:hypothetical protein
MYHESVHQYGFGKIGALREIALAKEEGYKWWYAGFYIHNCIKMKYKGDYSPQYVLDPVSYNWDSLDEEMKKRLDSRKFVSLTLEQTGKTPRLHSLHFLRHLFKLEKGRLYPSVVTQPQSNDQALDIDLIPNLKH